MTETSLLPMAAEAVGIGFEDLVDRLVRAALSRG
jgi:D-alanine-D-alanine ligase-like ATP-grasp enzyme